MTRAGKTSCWRIGSEKGWPSRMPFLVSMTALATTALPADWATMSSDSRTGTPAASSDERVDANRLSDALWTSGPKIGGFILKPSHQYRPFSVLMNRRKPMMAATMTTTTTRAFQLTRVFEIEMTTFVGYGSCPPRLLNSRLKIGTIATIMATKIRAMMMTTTTG